MSKSSINVQPASNGSEAHNNRLYDLDYVRDELSYLNEKWVDCSISDERKYAEARCKSISGRKLQKNATPIREGVLLFEDHHDIDDMHRVKDAIYEHFGIRTFQIYMHRDEGHFNEADEWKPNLHAHFLFNWTDERTGKMIPMKRKDMSELQTVVAKTLGMERGKQSDKVRLSAIEYKVKKLKDERLAQSRMKNYTHERLYRANEYMTKVEARVKKIAEKMTRAEFIEEVKKLDGDTLKKKLVDSIQTMKFLKEQADYYKDLYERSEEKTSKYFREMNKWKNNAPFAEIKEERKKTNERATKTIDSFKNFEKKKKNRGMGR